MAYAYVSGVDANGGSPQSGLTATCALTGMQAGNFVWLAIQVSSDGRSVSTLVDSASSVWVPMGSADDTANTKLIVYYCKSLNGAAPTVTVTWDSSAANNVYLWADEYTGLDTSKTVDQDDEVGNTGVSSINPTTPATTFQPEILYGAACSVNGFSRPLSTPSGMTRRGNYATGGFATMRCSYDQRLTSTGTQSVTYAVTGGNSNICGVIVTFPESAGGGGGIQASYYARRKRGILP